MTDTAAFAAKEPRIHEDGLPGSEAGLDPRPQYEPRYPGSALRSEMPVADDTAVRTRRREIAVEHLLFKLIGYVEASAPGLLDHLEASLDGLGDPARDDSKDDDVVREIARRMIAGVRAERGR